MKIISSLVTALTILYATPIFAQSNETVTLTNGKVIIGDLQYNDITGVLFHFTGSDRQRISPDSVKDFTIVDDEANRTRVFKTLPFKGTSGEVYERHFEILKETNVLSLLCMRDPINITNPVRRVSAVTNTPQYQFQRMDITTQQETVYIRDNHGAFYPYLLIEYTVNLDDLKRSKSSTKFIAGKNGLENLMNEAQLKDLQAYAKKKHLSFRKKDDLIKIWEYYDTIND